MASLVKVGEVTGLLEKALTKYADLLEWEEEFKSKLATMMIYPLMMLGLIGAIIVPAVKYSEEKKQLPERKP